MTFGPDVEDEARAKRELEARGGSGSHERERPREPEVLRDATPRPRLEPEGLARLDVLRDRGLLRGAPVADQIVHLEQEEPRFDEPAEDAGLAPHDEARIEAGRALGHESGAREQHRAVAEELDDRRQTRSRGKRRGDREPRRGRDRRTDAKRRNEVIGLVHLADRAGLRVADRRAAVGDAYARPELEAEGACASMGARLERERGCQTFGRRVGCERERIARVVSVVATGRDARELEPRRRLERADGAREQRRRAVVGRLREDPYLAEAIGEAVPFVAAADGDLESNRERTVPVDVVAERAERVRERTADAQGGRRGGPGLASLALDAETHDLELTRPGGERRAKDGVTIRRVRVASFALDVVVGDEARPAVVEIRVRARRPARTDRDE